MSDLSKECQLAFQQGYDAADMGLSETRNPYPLASDEHMSWNDGWRERDSEDDLT